MKNSRKFERMYAAVDSACRSQELDYAQKQTRLIVAKQRAEQLSALGEPATSAMEMYPDFWCAQVVKAFAEVRRLDRELVALGGVIRLAQLRRDKVGELWQDQRSAELSRKHEQNVSSSVELSLQLRRISLR